ncbi:MAG: hypothetical protein CVV33_00575 [Methanomicrobiales archaeon HGW-Methanomicrobiales-4]|nr:MAG: hypothetical protein CVV33_00575 [Methanomicrobiales archaeon HGW-Methanomicrobiales-4]
MMALLLVIAIVMAGCVSQAADKAINGSENNLKVPEQPDIPALGIKGKESVNKTSSGDSLDKKNYYNIRIVPASVLDQLQKEMGPEEFLIHNEKGDTIGIVSSESLVIRGDLVQLERSGVNSGKDFDKTDIATHLLDITFGHDNVKIDLFKSNKDYKFWFDARYTKADTDYVLKFAKQFNTLSGGTQFEDEEVTLGFLEQDYAEIPNNFYNIKIVSDKMLKVFFDDRKGSDHQIKDKDGVLIGLVNKDYLYLVDTLKDDERQYYMLKGILYSMGMHGTTYTDRESFFYREEGKNRELSDLDLESIKLLYGGGLKSGDTLEDARKSLGLST